MGMCKPCFAAEMRKPRWREYDRQRDALPAVKAVRNERLRKRLKADPIYRQKLREIKRVQHHHRLVGMELADFAEREGRRCYLCGDSVTDLALADIDHIVPTTRGGSGDLTNLALTHRGCNRRKQKRLVHELDWACPSALDRAGRSVDAERVR